MMTRISRFLVASVVALLLLGFDLWINKFSHVDLTLGLYVILAVALHSCAIEAEISHSKLFHVLKWVAALTLILISFGFLDNWGERLLVAAFATAYTMLLHSYIRNTLGKPS